MTVANTITDLTITFSESCHFDIDQKFASIALFNDAVRQAASEAPEDGSYDKTTFSFRWKGALGQKNTYRGRIDIVHSSRTDSPDHFTSLADHVGEFCDEIIEDPRFHAAIHNVSPERATADAEFLKLIMTIAQIEGDLENNRLLIAAKDAELTVHEGRVQSVGN